MHRSDDRHALDSHAREKEIAQRLMAEDPSLSKDHAIAKARAIMRDEEKRRNGD